MSELHFFMTHTDSSRFVEFLISRFKTTFHLDNSSNEIPPVFHEKEKIEKLIKESLYPPRFFVLSDLWQRYPLCTTEINAKDGRRFFSISQRLGGPAFDYHVSRNAEENGKLFIVPGHLSDSPWYMKDKKFISDGYGHYETFGRPDTMSEAYKEVQRYIRKNAKRSVYRGTNHVGPWILSDALAAYEQGIWLRIGDYHLDPR